MLASLLLPNGRCCSLNCTAAILFPSSSSAAMAAADTHAITMPHFGSWVQDLKCVQLICRQMPALQVPLVLNTMMPLLAAALLLCCSYLQAELPATASCLAGAYSAVWPHLAGLFLRTIPISMYLNPKLTLSNCSLAAAAAAAAYTLLLALL